MVSSENAQPAASTRQFCEELANHNKNRLLQWKHPLTLLPNLFSYSSLLAEKVIGDWNDIASIQKHKMVQVLVSVSYLTGCAICFEKMCSRALSCMTCGEIYHLQFGDDLDHFQQICLHFFEKIEVNWKWFYIIRFIQITCLKLKLQVEKSAQLSAR